MSEISKVNPQVLAAVWETQKAVNAPKVVWENSAGKAFQFVAQATAMAVPRQSAVRGRKHRRIPW